MQPEGDYRIPTLEAALGCSLSFRQLGSWVVSDIGAQHAMRLSNTGGANSNSCSTFCCEHPNPDFTTGWCAAQLDSKFGLTWVDVVGLTVDRWPASLDSLTLSKLRVNEAWQSWICSWQSGVQLLTSRPWSTWPLNLSELRLQAKSFENWERVES